MSLENTLWFWAPCNGSQTCSSKDPQITQTGCRRLWRPNCTYQIVFTSDVKCFVQCRMGWDFAFALMPYGVRWKKHRRAFQEYFHANELHKYIPIQRQGIRVFLRRVLVTPDDFVDHIYQWVSCLICQSFQGANKICFFFLFLGNKPIWRYHYENFIWN